MSKTLEQLNEEYKYDADFLKRGEHIHPIHKKWLEAAWEIHYVYGHERRGAISTGKAREFVTAIIEKYSQQNNQPHS